MVYWITGKAYSGKTTWLRHMQAKGHPVLFIGQELREKYGEKFFLNVDNPSTPIETEKEVRKMIEDFLLDDWGISNNDIFIDGFPRSINQLECIQNWGDLKHRIVIIDIYPERKIKKQLTDDKHQLVLKRRENEKHLFQDMLYYHSNYKTFFLTDVTMRVCRLRPSIPINCWEEVIRNAFNITSFNSNLEHLLERHKQLDKLYIKRYGISSDEIAKTIKSGEKTTYHQISFLEDMFLRLSEETKEAYDEIHKKFWDGNNIDARRIRVELVDILHFWFTAAICLGMDGEDIGRIYLEKRQVNMDRIKQGKKKGDDDHVGELKG